MRDPARRIFIGFRVQGYIGVIIGYILGYNREYTGVILVFHASKLSCSEEGIPYTYTIAHNAPSFHCVLLFAFDSP